MIKRILALLDNSPYTGTVVDYACFFAKHQNAVVSGMSVLNTPGIIESIGSIPVGGAEWAEDLKEFHRAKEIKIVKKTLLRFKEECESHKSSYDEFMEEGDPIDLISRTSKYYDLVITGLRSYFSYLKDDQPADIFNSILNHSITPILATPDKYSPIENIIIAYDGSPASARALQRFAHISTYCDFNIKLLSSSLNEAAALEELDSAKNYLNAYGIKNIEIDITQKEIFDVLSADYKKWADLIVLGAHSKHNIKEFLLGSLTKKLIEEVNKPLFIGI